MTEKDHRRFPRAALGLDVRIDVGGEVSRAETLDLTVHGISFKLGRPLAADDEFYVDIPATADIKSARLRAKVLRCDKNPESKDGGFVVRAGFLEANDEYLMDILAVVNSLYSSS